LGYSLFEAYPPRGDEGVMHWSALAGVGILVAFIVAGFFLIFVNRKSALFFFEVESESRKVHWPDWATVKGSTGQVIVVMVFLLVFLFAVDLVLVQLRDLVL